MFLSYFYLNNNKTSISTLVWFICGCLTRKENYFTFIFKALIKVIRI